jgi:hypothetical protein
MVYSEITENARIFWQDEPPASLAACRLLL